MLEALDAEAIGRRNCSTNTGKLHAPNSPSSRPRATGAWAPIRTPTAACCCKDLQLPDFRDYAVDVPEPGAVECRSHARPGRRFCAT